MSAYALPGLFPPLEHTILKPSLPPSQKALSDVNIIVKDARIDPARLVQSLSCSSSKSGCSSNGYGSIRQSHTMCQQQRRRPRTVYDADTMPLTTPQEDSMQFELSIMWNGKKYTAIRSFSTILKLRQELVRELGLEQSSSYTTASELDKPAFRHFRGYHQSQIATPSVAIPEVPRISDDNNLNFCGTAGGSSGVVGRGFLFLQSMLSAYSPKLEGWLRLVTSIIPPNDSPSLSSFLCEEWKRLRSDLQLDLSLSSIEETEHDDCDE